MANDKRQNQQAAAAAAPVVAAPAIATAGAAPEVAVAPSVAHDGHVRVVFSRPYTSDGTDTKKVRGGTVIANGQLTNVPIRGMALNGIGVRLLDNKDIAITMPTTAAGMLNVIGGMTVKLEKPVLDARGRKITESLSEDSIEALEKFADAMRDAWARANQSGNAFNPAGFEISL